MSDKKPDFNNAAAVLHARALSNPENRRGYRHTATLAAAVSAELVHELRVARRMVLALRDVIVQYDPNADPVREIDAVLERAELVAQAMGGAP